MNNYRELYVTIINIVGRKTKKIYFLIYLKRDREILFTYFEYIMFSAIYLNQIRLVCLRIKKFV